jgi:hypothetical protein
MSASSAFQSGNPLSGPVPVAPLVAYFSQAFSTFPFLDTFFYEGVPAVAALILIHAILPSKQARRFFPPHYGFSIRRSFSQSIFFSSQA